MSKVVRAEADGWWRSLLNELLTIEQERGLYGRIVITPGKSRTRVQVAAELWKADPEQGSIRAHTYMREWPHGDHNYLSGACWLAMIQVLKLADERESYKRADD